MGTGAITAYIDVAQIVLYIFWIFFFWLVVWLVREGKREGYPLQSDRRDYADIEGWPPLPSPKTYKLADGREFSAPHDRDRRQRRWRSTDDDPALPVQNFDQRAERHAVSIDPSFPPVGTGGVERLGAVDGGVVDEALPTGTHSDRLGRPDRLQQNRSARHGETGAGGCYVKVEHRPSTCASARPAWAMKGRLASCAMSNRASPAIRRA